MVIWTRRGLIQRQGFKSPAQGWSAHFKETKMDATLRWTYWQSMAWFMLTKLKCMTLLLYLILSIGMLYYQEDASQGVLTMSQCSSNSCELLRDPKATRTHFLGLSEQTWWNRFLETGGNSFVSAVSTASCLNFGRTGFGNRWHRFLLDL